MIAAHSMTLMIGEYAQMFLFPSLLQLNCSQILAHFLDFLVVWWNLPFQSLRINSMETNFRQNT